MKTKYKFAKDIKPGDIVILDMGYGCHTHDVPCKIVKIRNTYSLFDKEKSIPLLSFGYRADNGGVDWTCNFNREDKFTIV